MTLEQIFPAFYSRWIVAGAHGKNRVMGNSTFGKYPGIKAAEYFKPALYSSCCSDRINVLFYSPSF